MSNELKTTDVISDVNESLGSFLKKVEEWIERFGEDAIIKTDAGFNNVDIKIIHK